MNLEYRVLSNLHCGLCSWSCPILTDSIFMGSRESRPVKEDCNLWWFDFLHSVFFPGASIDQFTFKGSKKAFSHCAIIGITHTAHRWTYAHSLHRLPNSTLVYWLPWSLWWITLPGLRVINAMFRAPITRLVVMFSAKDQPTPLRLNTSMITAKYRNPDQVGM